MWKYSRPQFDLTIRGRETRLGDRTLVMGILNVTPDSFSEGGRYFETEKAVAHGVELVRQGADWLDVGGESTRPGAQPVTEEQELRRVLPVIRALRRKLKDVPISIDTTKSKVAEQALEAGADIVNDISGLRFDLRIADVARANNVPLVLMHARGRPLTMQKMPFVCDIWRSLMGSLEASIDRALRTGVKRPKLILDPGLGFGKSRRQNYEIVAGLRRLERFHLPILVGASRKSFVKAVVRGEGLESLPATPSRMKPRRNQDFEKAALLPVGDATFVAAAILGGANIVRVHDPASILPAVRVADAVLAAR